MPKMRQYDGYDDWRTDQSAKNQQLIGALQQLIEEVAPHLATTVKWGQGCFADGDVHRIYLHAADDHVQLGFYEGSSLADPAGLLEGSGKYVRHVKVRETTDVDPESFASLIRQVTG